MTVRLMWCLALRLVMAAICCNSKQFAQARPPSYNHGSSTDQEFTNKITGANFLKFEETMHMFVPSPTVYIHIRGHDNIY